MRMTTKEAPRSSGTDADLLRAAVRQFCDEEIRPLRGATREKSPATTYNRVVWERMATELELMGFSIPRAFGGAGFSWLEQAVVFEELGRVLAELPYFSTVALAARALQASEDHSAMSRYLPRLASGEAVATLATAVESTGPQVQARRAASGVHLLSGCHQFVPDGHLAGLLLVTAYVGGAPALFAVEASAPGVSAVPLTSLDLTRAVARVDFSEATAQLVGEIGAGEAYVRSALDFAGGALSAEQVGGMSRCLELSVDQAISRHQFGRPIGSFQAIKHQCVDMLVQLELARGLADDACATATASPEELSLASAVAQAFCTDSYRRVAAATIHIHGGIGFTWEHEAHLHYRRAHTNASIQKNPRELRESIAQRYLG